MSPRRTLKAIALYVAFSIAGTFSAIALSFLISFAINPHADGAPGDGILILGLWVLLIPFGIALGCVVAASVISRQRTAKLR